MHKLLTLLLIFYTFLSLSGQTKERDSILGVLEKYDDAYDFKSTLTLSKASQKDVVPQTATDSLYLASLIYYEANGISQSGNIPAMRKAYNSAITMCPNTDDGNVLKAITISSSCVIEHISGLNIIAYKKTEEALAILERVEKPVFFEILTSLNTVMAQNTLDFEEMEKHKTYLSKANNVFYAHENDYKTSAKMKFYISMLRFLKAKDGEEKDILKLLHKIKNIDDKASDPTYEFKLDLVQITIAEFYLQQFNNGNKFAAKKAYRILENVLNDKSSDRMTEYYKKYAWYIKNELLLAENKLELALISNTELISICKPKESRLRHNVYQRIKILLALGRYKEAQKELYEMVVLFHSGKDILNKDYLNFESSQKIEYVSIFLELSHAFETHISKKNTINETVLKLNKLALLQLTNSVENKLTTPKTRRLFDQIISNIIKSKKYGLGKVIPNSKLIELIENTNNTLNWQEFLQNRAYAELPFINNYKYEEVALRNQLVEVRKKKQDSTVLKLELQLEQLQQNFEEAHPGYSKFAFSDFKILDFQNEMQNDEVVLRYKNINDSLYTFVISKTDVNLVNLGLSNTISQSVKTYLSSISKRTDANALSKKLYNQLLPQDISVYNHINLIPDTYLFKLPFETLKSTSGNYLIEEKSVLYAPYLSLLQHNSVSNTNQDQTSLMIFTPTYNSVVAKSTEVVVRGNAYRLNGAKKESQLLADLFENTSFSNYSATKENFKQHAPDGQLLHLSMHANINADTPELSYLLFTEGNTDNKLYLEELYGMNLKADMAVLSACKTGVGELDLDKGIISLHRAFTQAGVPTTVSSLWSAPDNATQKIMVQFYKELKLGKTKAEALQQAKLNYLKTTDNAMLKAPFYWAGFVINGDNKAIMLPSSETNYLLWLGLGAGVIMLLIILYFRKK
jgi:CHAT domain-containing protein